ncbi:MAG: dihydrofolate reductase [Puniceicoccales bacterium]|nr:dihydrofolate reductase [Puniceicoccales bacterium]
MRAIVAIDAGGAIGRGGKLPWHLPEDMALFRRMTLGHTVIVGRRTYDSFGGPLPGRSCWVLSRHSKPEDGRPDANPRHFHSAESLLKAANAAADGSEFWVAGGAEIYKLFAPHCCEIIETAIFAEYGGDVRWEIPNYFTRTEILLQTDKFTVYRWRRRQTG